MTLSSKARRACLHLGMALAVLVMAVLAPVLATLSRIEGPVLAAVYPPDGMASLAILVTATVVAFAAPFGVAYLASMASALRR
jgi:hypothetical protein